MNIFTLTIPAQGEDKNLIYNVRIKDNYGNISTVFTGKVFVTSNQTTINIDLQDILHNYKFDGSGFVSPKINNSGDDYIMCNTSNAPNNYWYNQVTVEIPDLSVSVNKNVCFFNYNMFNNYYLPVAENTIVFNMNYQPICHLPKTLPNGFEFRQLVYKGTFTKTIDNTTTQFTRNNLGIVSFTGGNYHYDLNGETICLIDNCEKPYYLMWLTNCGTMQVQGFLKSSESKITYNNNKRVDMSNYEWLFNQTTRGEWNLKSQNLSDKDYKAYGEMFNSPYLILLDMENNRLHYVNVIDTTYTQKKNTSGKKIYFEVNIRSSEIKVI